MFVAYILFCVCEVLMAIQHPCCSDEWLPAGTWYNRTVGNATSDDTVSWHILPKATVSNTATGMYFYYKVAAYTGECVAGVFLILSHLTVWWYCEERHVQYGDSVLEMVYNQRTEEDDESVVFDSDDCDHTDCSDLSP